MGACFLREGTHSQQQPHVPECGSCIGEAVLNTDWKGRETVLDYWSLSCQCHRNDTAALGQRPDPHPGLGTDKCRPAARWSWATWLWMRQCGSLFRSIYALQAPWINLATTPQILLCVYPWNVFPAILWKNSISSSNTSLAWTTRGQTEN